jgi:hypothetical protein
MVPASDQLYGAVPPAAEQLEENETPARAGPAAGVQFRVKVPAGGAAATVSVSQADAEAPLESFTVNCTG